jgi:hypothetical protein
VVTTLDCAPVQAEHEANTDCVLRRATGVLHRAGGWPDNVDVSEAEQVRRRRRPCGRRAARAPPPPARRRHPRAAAPAARRWTGT